MLAKAICQLVRAQNKLGTVAYRRETKQLAQLGGLRDPSRVFFSVTSQRRKSHRIFSSFCTQCTKAFVSRPSSCLFSSSFSDCLLTVRQTNGPAHIADCTCVCVWIMITHTYSILHYIYTHLELCIPPLWMGGNGQPLRAVRPLIYTLCSAQTRPHIFTPVLR